MKATLNDPGDPPSGSFRVAAPRTANGCFPPETKAPGSSPRPRAGPRTSPAAVHLFAQQPGGERPGRHPINLTLSDGGPAALRRVIRCAALRFTARPTAQSRSPPLRCAPFRSATYTPASALFHAAGAAGPAARPGASAPFQTAGASPLNSCRQLFNPARGRLALRTSSNRRAGHNRHAGLHALPRRCSSATSPQIAPPSSCPLRAVVRRLCASASRRRARGRVGQANPLLVPVLLHQVQIRSTTFKLGVRCSDSLPPLAAGATAPQVGGPPAADWFASLGSLALASCSACSFAACAAVLPHACACTRGCGPACPSASLCVLRTHEGRTLGARRPCAPSSLARSRTRRRKCAGRRDPSRPSLRKACAPPRVPPHSGRCSAVVRCSAVQGEGLAVDGADTLPKTCALRMAPGRRTFPSVPLDRFLLAARVVSASGGASVPPGRPLPRQACPRPPPCVNAREGVRGHAWRVRSCAGVREGVRARASAQTGATRPQRPRWRAAHAGRGVPSFSFGVLIPCAGLNRMPVLFYAKRRCLPAGCGLCPQDRGASREERNSAARGLRPQPGPRRPSDKAALSDGRCGASFPAFLQRPGMYCRRCLFPLAAHVSRGWRGRLKKKRRLHACALRAHTLGNLTQKTLRTCAFVRYDCRP